jgi:hypothetical protein
VVKHLDPGSACRSFGLSLGTVTVGGRLHLAFRYRHPLLDAGAARRFAERYAAALDLFTAPAGD